LTTEPRLPSEPNRTSGSPRHLFLDANVYLSFYRLSDDALEQLGGLVTVVRSNETTLYLPTQVEDEFKRNRASTIADSLKAVGQAKLPTTYPRLFMDMDGYAEMRAALSEYEDRRKDLVAKVRDLAVRVELRADHLINDLFGLARRSELSSTIIDAARLRNELGRPPGKRGSIGDAVNWESLLREVPDGEHLVVVSGDSDFESSLNRGAIDETLAAEWDELKRSTVTLHKSLGSAFSADYPAIQLQEDPDEERAEAVAGLVDSPNFAWTHRAIRGLRWWSDFTAEEAESLMEAVSENSQVGGIIADDDVKSFFADLLATHGDRVPDDVASRLQDRLWAVEDL